MANVPLKEITKSFGSVDWRKSVDLGLPSHEFASMVGPSGCRKSTLPRVIAGPDNPTGGVRINGRDVTGAEPVDRGISRVSCPAPRIHT